MSRSDRLAYYQRALDFWLEASRIQQQRCLEASPTDTHARADICFYVVAVQRIREAARMTADRAGLIAAREALGEFDALWPQFADLRNDDEHIRGPWPDAPKDTFAASGHWGQMLFVIPSLDIIIVRYGDDREKAFIKNEFLKLVKESVIR